MVSIQIQKLREGVTLPSYAHEGDSGMDLSALEHWRLKPGERHLFKIGLAVNMPAGYEAQVRSRSGLAIKSGVAVLNSPGTVDSSYIGELGVILINHSDQDFYVEPGMRIAQLVFCPVAEVDLLEVDAFTDWSTRGTGGFGSTGV